jgi:hypothetical protein
MVRLDLIIYFQNLLTRINHLDILNLQLPAESDVLATENSISQSVVQNMEDQRRRCIDGTNIPNVVVKPVDGNKPFIIIFG